MSASDWINTPCTLIRRKDTTTQDDFGNLTKAATSTATVCELQQQQRGEVGGAQVSETRWNVFFRPGTVFDTGDAVDVPGQGTFEFVGGAWTVSAPWSQAPSHVQSTARQIAGAEEQS